MGVRIDLDQRPPGLDKPPRFVSWPCENVDSVIMHQPLVRNHQPNIEENTRASRQQVALVNVILGREVWDTFAS